MQTPDEKSLLKQALQSLIADGTIVRIEEIDPDTGKLRFRYFHRDFAPKPN